MDQKPIKTTPIKTVWAPTTQWGLKGLATFDDPQFIDDHALAGCLNMVIDGAQIAPRPGTNLLYAAPDGETGLPEQLFKFTDAQAKEYLLAKYTEHWYLRDTFNDDWVLIGSQDRADSLFNGATWHDAYYSNDMYAHGIGANIAFFAPSDYSEPDNDSDTILMWPAGITYLSADAHIGDTTVAVDNASILNLSTSPLLSIGGDRIVGVSGSNYTTTGTLTDGSDIITDIPTTGAITVGSAVTAIGLAGGSIPAGTVVENIIDANSIQISNPVDTTIPATLNGLGTISSGSDTVTGFGSNLVGPGDTVSGSTTINNWTISSTAGAAIVVGMGVTGTGITAGTTLVSFSQVSGIYTLIISASATASNTATSITLYNDIEVGISVTGTGIPNGTMIATLVGSAPLYTGFTMTNNATLDITNNGLTFFQPNPTATIQFTENNIIVVQVQPLTANYPAGTAVTGVIQNASSVPSGNCLLVWQAHLIVAAGDGLIHLSGAGLPLDFSAATSSINTGHSGRITDLKGFGQFFLAASEDAIQVGQEIVSADVQGVGVYLTSYLAGQGMGAVSASGGLSYNNQYYYPTSTNGIIGLTPSFTGSSSSSAAIQVLTDVIHNLYQKFTFLRSAAFNRKIWWRVSVAATPTSPITYYYLVLDLIRNGFTVISHPSVDLAVFQEQLCLFGEDGNIYQGEYDSYEDYLEGESVSYLAEAVSKRFDMGEPSLPKDGGYCLVQGRILTGTTFNIDVLYNEGGSLGKTTYQISGDTSQDYFVIPAWDSMGHSPLAVEVLAAAELGVGFFRVYIELDKAYKFYNYQLRFWSDSPGAFWSIGVISPDVEVSTVPRQLVISPA